MFRALRPCNVVRRLVWSEGLVIRADRMVATGCYAVQRGRDDLLRIVKGAAKNLWKCEIIKGPQDVVAP